MRTKLAIALVAGLVAATALVAGGADAPKRGGFTVNKGQGPDPVTIRALQAAEQERVRYRGLVVKPHPDAEGAELQFQREVGAALAQLDFVPAQRLAHIAWLADFPVVLTGWTGTITRTDVVPAGVRVTMEVYPTHTGGGIAAVNDPSIETYLYTGSRIEFLGYERRNDGRPRAITIN